MAGFLRRAFYGSGHELRKVIAERPHPVSIALLLLSSVLSLLVGTVAVVISLASLFVTQHNMQIGQRAYLTVTDTRFSSNAKDPKDSGVQNVKPSDHVLQLLYSFTVHNVGNTPGHIEDVKTPLKCPAGWACYTIYDNHPSLIGPRSDVRVEGGADAILTDAAWQEYTAPAKSRMGVEGASHLSYHDEFTNEDSVDWCWREDVRQGKAFSYECAGSR